MSYEKELEKFCQKHPDALVLTAENRALIRNLPGVLGSRFVDTGITEQTMVGMAAGLALQGRRVVCHALAAFLTMRAFEFVRTDVGIPGLPVKFTGFIPGLLSDANGATHQAIEDMALMLGIPGMEVYCPADLEDMLLMCQAVWESPKPAYLRAVHLSSGLQHKPYVPGLAEWMLEGPADVVFLVAGMLLPEVMKAASILEKSGIRVAVANMRSLRPLDEHALRQACTWGALVVCVEDHFQRGGLTSLFKEWLAENMGSLQASGTSLPEVMSISLGHSWFTPGLLADVLRHHRLLGEDVAERVLAWRKERPMAEA
ncbi:MAG: hypothetical protein N2050_08240 [Flavobacteriales bacterium]|nr:hypothetical protein [Flavobacteriales bacterium]MCX7650524.1 hypothetical protein [Flavobacteriales bacterium]MDW8431733.1 transketolase C-terminal domain-containing protein [Flavobacteriales bacterium]